ncbi:MAG TPA: glycosyltransferase N-terminal domain-containing protein [bacterium]|nr:glycosyltransferase N-terminal domain-containing protein [bacterium]HOH07264.1 glycosyltransferase N-terminal domain-containing protein [bacterium]HOY44987.1 glycosyltransferase N-terminal domain-containing protein [bacterium]HPG83319.1 glycosyltransferase N-terminal domain-containing protein [bacterium]HPM59400.1 glycosyltransferase N-terminal domain-containing protein [bacterium]
MQPIILLLYNGIFIPLFMFSVRLAALFNNKVARGVAGRRALLNRLAEQCAVLPDSGPRIWIHISSLGEFEQARPIVRALRSRLPGAAIALSFFSPSGYEPARSYREADLITYLPLDSWRQSGAFLDLLKPSLHLIIRHDIWPNMQRQLQRRGIPSLLVDASLTPQRLRTVRRLRAFIRPVYATFAEVLVTTPDNAAHFHPIYPWPERIHVCGDTRYDQVSQRALETGKIEFLLESGRFTRERCLVIGSSWPSDERVILPAVVEALARDPGFRVIIAPHETTEEHLRGIESHLAGSGISFLRLGEFSPASPDFQVLLIDRIGLLANLYALGGLAFVGGGFGPGVHSVLEPAAHGCAVCFGPHHVNSLEAAALLRRGGGVLIDSTAAMDRALQQFLSGGEEMRRIGGEAGALVRENLGASGRVVEAILRHLKSIKE